MQEPREIVTAHQVKVNALPSKEWLDQLFEYRPEEGLFWKLRPEDHFKSQLDWYIWNKRFAEKMAGGQKIKTYKTGKRRDHSRVQMPICPGGKLATFAAHRLAYVLMGQAIPDGMVVDHIDGDPWNNKWSNLRLGTYSQNMNNSAGWRKRKHDLPKGVYCDGNREKKYYAMLKVGSKYKRFPYRDTIQEAHEDYRIAAAELHGEFLNLGISKL